MSVNGLQSVLRLLQLPSFPVVYCFWGGSSDSVLFEVIGVMVLFLGRWHSDLGGFLKKQHSFSVNAKI